MKSIFAGGILPAILIGFALTGIKYVLEKGVTPQGLLILAGIGVLGTGLGTTLLIPESSSFSLRGVVGGISVGIFWGLGTFLMSYSVRVFNLPMSVSASLAATNALITALLSLILFKEYETLSVIKLLTGTLCITVGAILITQS
ncbi:hypothetical protein [Chitinivibrio alkaliphilus]|uniref:EamA domain-containing protein n=1 Tax=Chitinivibrio alkaliphilus ACht1 TaxID=1313304 RepID=U7D976_9BACT|nr:hypothetical protein [Chitinivibrio alkaliphilus]ERP32136.1 hypothetical protein CALK_0861 [Chitinivibrio alkaliphilus ACht1]